MRKRAGSLFTLKNTIFLFLGFFAIYHVFMHTDYWDDAVFSSVLKNYNYNILQFTYDRYTQWSSRIFIEAVLVVIAALPHFIWKILDVLILLLLYKDLEWIIKNIFDIKDEKIYILLACLICAYPFPAMASTGWIATTMNYLWVLALGGYAITRILKLVSLNTELKKREVLLLVPAILYSASFESMALILFIIFLTAVGFIKLKQKGGIPPVLWMCMILVSLLLAYIALCPGNRMRPYTDAEIWMPEYFQLNLADKLRMGIVTAFYQYVSIPAAIFFLLNMLCFAGVFWRTHNPLRKLISCLPVLIDMLWTGYFFINYLAGRKSVTYQIPGALLSGGGQIDYWEQIAALLSVALWLLSVLYSMYWMIEDKKSFYLCCVILFTGLLPELVVGMTPTVVTSMLRTTIYLYMAMILICIVLYRETVPVMKTHNWTKKAIHLVVAAGILLNAVQIIRHLCVYG